jgi:hypothetical protein
VLTFEGRLLRSNQLRCDLLYDDTFLPFHYRCALNAQHAHHFRSQYGTPG